MKYGPDDKEIDVLMDLVADRLSITRITRREPKDLLHTLVDLSVAEARELGALLQQRAAHVERHRHKMNRIRRRNNP